MQKIMPGLWFDSNCEEAMNFYVSVFPNSRITSIMYYPREASDPHLQGMDGKVLHGEFELAGQKFTALDGGPLFKFNEATSFVINCEDQEEIDYYWEKLSTVPEAEQCGWCKDKYGVSWQIIPEKMAELVSTPTALDAMMKMKKIDIVKLEQAK